MQHHAGEVGRRLDETVVLGDGHRHPHHIGLLERIGADHQGAHLPGDRDDPGRVHHRVGDPGQEVRRARTRGGHADADLSGDPVIPDRGVGRHLLVADQDVPDLAGVVQRIVERKRGSAGMPEHHIDPYPIEALDEGAGARHPFRHAGRYGPGPGP